MTDEEREAAIRKKARFVVSVVQGTMGLEGQGLDPEQLARLTADTERLIREQPATATEESP